MTPASISAGTAAHEDGSKTVDEKAESLAKRYRWRLLFFAALALIPFVFAPDKPGPEVWVLYYGLLALASGWCSITWILGTARLYFGHRAMVSATDEGRR